MDERQHPDLPAVPARVSRRRLLQQTAGGTLVLLLGPKELAWGSELVAVRVWPADDYTRVTLESDVALNATFFSIGGPDRLVIDVEGLALNSGLRELISKIRHDDPYIAGVRVGQNRPNVARIVLDLKQPIKPQVFGLAPVAAYKHRLVFDLYPLNEADPKLAMQAVPTEAPPAQTAPSDPAGQAPSSPAQPDVARPNLPDSANSREAAQAMNDALEDFIGKLHRQPQPGSERNVAKAPVKPLDKPQDEVPVGNAKAGAQRLVIVALDAGHGGEDPGAVGPSGLYEKDVVLSVAQKLRALINAQPGMRAMLTRESDYFVPLHERVVKARRVKADLFVSIHADAFMNPKARGASVFALSENGASSATARWIAKKENASDLVGGVNIKAKDKAVMRALLDMSTTAQIKDSLKLGTAVLGHLGKVGRLHKPRVEQASFAVLKAPDIPSILVETGFISNPEEEGKLKDEAYQRELANALLKGIQRYFEKNPPLARNRAL